MTKIIFLNSKESVYIPSHNHDKLMEKVKKESK